MAALLELVKPLSNGDINENCCNKALAVIPPSAELPPAPTPAIATAAAARLLFMAADGDADAGVAGNGWITPGGVVGSMRRWRLEPGLRNSWVLDLSFNN